MVRVLVTGGEGFIGRHLSRALIRRGHDVVVLGRPGPMRRDREEREPNLLVRRLDMNDRGALGALFREMDFDTVYHLAANTRRARLNDLGDWAASVDEDLRPLINLTAAAACAPRPPVALIRAGTIAEYGAEGRNWREDDVCCPVTSYGAALLSGTQYLRAMAPLLPFAAVTARLALTYGAGQSSSFLAARLCSDLPEGRAVLIQRPEDRRDLIHVDDVVEALMAVAGQSGVLNVSTGDAPTMRELAATVIGLTGADPALVRFGRMSGPPGVLQADNLRIAERTGWQPAVSLREGLRRTLNLPPQHDLSKMSSEGTA